VAVAAIVDAATSFRARSVPDSAEPAGGAPARPSVRGRRSLGARAPEAGRERREPPAAAGAGAGEARTAGTAERLDGEAFSALVRAYHPSLVRVAMAYVRDPVIAEDVAQETWLGVIRGMDRFAGRCSLKTWIFRILTNIAKTRAERESRSVPFSSFEDDAGESVEAEQFIRPADRIDGRWSSAPLGWREPDALLLAKETRHAIAAAIGRLPPMQRRVITLRSLEGRSAQEVCELLGLTEVNQRVLLHRARSKVRTALSSTSA
jgi:RNA polymerase sigma-70 factor (ECF subfamily)